MRQTAIDFDAIEAELHPVEPWWLLRPHGYEGRPGEGYLVRAVTEWDALWQAGYAPTEMQSVERADP